MTGLSINYFAFNTFGRAFVVTILSLIIPYIISIMYVEGLLRFLIGTLCSEFISIILIVILGLNKEERLKVFNKLKHVFVYAK